MKPFTDAQRFPLLDERIAQTMKALREHPNSPTYNYTCGDMLSAEALQQVRAYEKELAQEENHFRERGQIPRWLQKYFEWCQREVPFYRRSQIDASTHFFEWPTIKRRDIAREPWSFVPDSQPLDELMLYWTSGTTDSKLTLLADPRSATMYLPLIKRALQSVGVTMETDELPPGQVAMALVCAQKQTMTFASASSYLHGAGFVKINLHPDDWKNSDDPAKFLESIAPQIITGDPVSFVELMKLFPSTHNFQPRALVSAATTLLPALKRQLESHFGCPVIDVYSITEVGPIGFAVSENTMEVLPHDLYVESLRADGTPCDENERGEIVVSGGRNPFLPLLRYRTGDWARLEIQSGKAYLCDFAGRAPIVFQDDKGGLVTSMDVGNTLRQFTISHFGLHQNADASLLLRVPKDADEDALRAAITTLFGALPLRIEYSPELQKTLYSSDLKFA